MRQRSPTPFPVVYDSFLSKITDDMYMELTKEETESMLEELLLSAIYKFEFPRVNLFDIQRKEVVDSGRYCGWYSDYQSVPCLIYQEGQFNNNLTAEEINIVATYMIVEWLGQQLASVENTRMKYSGSNLVHIISNNNN